MSHHIYTTPAVVLASTPAREADRRYTLLTEQFGIIWANALGVRRNTSKLRYALQDFSMLSVSLVRGREYWRITNARADQNIYWRQQTNQQLLETVARIFRLLTRLVPGEEKNEQLYQEVVNALDFVNSCNLSGDDVVAFEHIIVLRILRDLGYNSASHELIQFLSSPWSAHLITEACDNRKKIVTAINFSLQQSQL